MTVIVQSQNTELVSCKRKHVNMTSLVLYNFLSTINSLCLG
jgi:hypothetical protein